jgi:glyoxylase-like metal-dependent hydrolase (beta-lactamase superfamily II)
VFDDKLTLNVGAKRIELYNVGPAHTGGDTLVYLPQDRIVYTGDIIFAEAHPIVWDGPVSNWIKACELMLRWGAEVVVPGHGPISDLSVVRETKRYWEYLTSAARKRFDAGMPADQAIRDISLDEFKGWIDPERIVVNVHALYREFRGQPGAPDMLEMAAKMLHFRNEKKRGH